jgi:hypothetical protein
MLIYKGKKKIRENKEGNLSGATSLLCVTMQPVYFVFFFALACRVSPSVPRSSSLHRPSHLLHQNFCFGELWMHLRENRQCLVFVDHVISWWWESDYQKIFLIERGGPYILAIKMFIYKGKKKIRENKEVNKSGATSLLCVTMQPRHNHGDGLIFLKIYHEKSEGYFET